MLKKFLLALAVAIPATTFAQKFATVNVEEVIGAMPEMTQMQNTLNEASKQYETEFQKLQLLRISSASRNSSSPPSQPASMKP